MVDARMPKLTYSVATLRKVRGKSDLERALNTIRDLYGFAHLVFLSVGLSGSKQPRMAYCTTYPDAWTLHYIEKDYFRIDPVVTIYRSGFQPVDWSLLNRSSTEIRNLFREARDMGIGRNGVTVSVRGPSGERSIFSATSNAPGKEWRDFRVSSEHDLMLLSYYMHDCFLGISGTRHHHGQLSRRERQCLQFLARGVAPKRIAHELGLSESAVRLYLGSARRKLDAATTYQAVSRASFLELIEL